MYFNKQILKEDLIETMKIIKVFIKYWGLKILIALSLTALPYSIGKNYNTLRYGPEYTPEAFKMWAMGIIILLAMALIITSLFLFVCLLAEVHKRYFKKPVANNNRLDVGGSDHD